MANGNGGYQLLIVKTLANSEFKVNVTYNYEHGRWKATEWYASEIHTVVLDLVYQDVEDCGQLTILAGVLHSNKSTKDK